MARKGENIFKRKDGRWEARYICRHENGKAKYAYIYASSYSEVKAKKLAVQSLPKMTETTGAKQRATFETLAVLWLAYMKNSVKESTYAHYHRIVEKYLHPIIGERILLKLEQQFLNSIPEKLLISGGASKGQLSPKTVTGILCVLKSILKFGSENQFPVPNADGLKYPYSCSKRIKILTEENRIQIEKEAIQSNDFLSLGILITLFTGLRLGELCGLKWGDINFASSFMTVCRTVERITDLNPFAKAKTKVIISEPKTKSSVREIPLPKFLISRLQSCRAANDCYVLTGDTVFMEPHCFYMNYKRYLKKNGLANYNFHSLRHTFATRCVELGFDVKSLSEILGHSSITTTLSVYVHPTLQQKKRQMNKLTVES